MPQAEITRFLDAWFAMRQFIQAANFNRFQGAGLSATQFMTLNLLPATGEGMAMGELARSMNLKRATVARTVDSLEARDLVARSRSAADKRVIRVKVTAAGMRLQNAATGTFHQQIEQVFSAIPAQQRAAMLSGLESFVRTAQPASARGPEQIEATIRAARVAPQAKRNSPRSARA